MTTQVLITNAYSARNRGDAAIVLGMIESLRRTDILREAEIHISSADHPADSAWYPVPTVPSFHSIKNGFSGYPSVNLLYFIVVLLPLSLLWALAWRALRFDLPLPSTMGGLLRTYAAADVVVAAGGGYLYTNSAIRGNVVLLVNIYSFFFAVLLGKSVCLYAQSIGPFAGSGQSRFARWALSRVALVEIREGVSRRLVDGWRIPTPIRSVADAAFLLQARPPSDGLEFVRSTGGPTVGMTVRNWFRDREQQVGYERTMAAFVDWLIVERGARVIFLPQVTYTDGRDDDRETARKVAAQVVRTDGVLVAEDELAAAEIMWLCGRMDFFVGTRMHSNIFALSSGVPTLAIAYQPKTRGIMSGLGLGDHVLPIETLSAVELQRGFDTLVQRGSEITELLATALPEVREQALEAGRLIAEVVVRWGDRAAETGQAK